jgi:hypothetical protein
MGFAGVAANTSEHGMRIFFGHLTDESTREVISSVAYVDKDANTKAILLARETIDELFALCSGIGELLGAMLHWHKLRIEITKSGKQAIQSPVFGKSTGVNRQIGAGGGIRTHEGLRHRISCPEADLKCGTTPRSRPAPLT